MGIHGETMEGTMFPVMNYSRIQRSCTSFKRNEFCQSLQRNWVSLSSAALSEDAHEEDDKLKTAECWLSSRKDSNYYCQHQRHLNCKILGTEGWAATKKLFFCSCFCFFSLFCFTVTFCSAAKQLCNHRWDASFMGSEWKGLLWSPFLDNIGHLFREKQQRPNEAENTT